MDITPGTTVSVEITAPPTRAAAIKTLNRVCRKDHKVAEYHRIMKDNRPSWQLSRRGGRWWHHQMRTRPNVQLVPGAKYTVRATVDVLRDLASVERWVKVTPA
jgi:hypothetical protein